ncbi:MAG: hypothetical protein NC078_11375 [Ruminococcus sp.]|nr:hypothetical protein [Ruminococcus sp.]
MLRDEFEIKLPAGVKPPTYEEYKAIELVYTYHPCIGETEGKSRIAWLYCEFGMRIIYDMEETARRIMEIEDEKSRLENELEELETELDELLKGVKIR